MTPVRERTVTPENRADWYDMMPDDALHITFDDTGLYVVRYETEDEVVYLDPETLREWYDEDYDDRRTTAIRDALRSE